MRCFRTSILIFVVTLCIAGFSAPSCSAWQPKDPDVRDGKESLDLDSKKVTESSGLAFSLRDKDCLWTLNDSGGEPRLYAFNEKGNPCGQVTLEGIKAKDWEAMSAYEDEVPRLLVADVGDNPANRNSVSLYLFDEPDPKKKTKLKSFQHLVVRYANGARNCEAVAVDIKRRKILFLSKTPFLATVHQVDLPARIKESDPAISATVTKTAYPIARVALPMSTGMDICNLTGDIWICNYFMAYRYAGDESKSLDHIFRTTPVSMDLPKLKQVEAIAIDNRSRVWVTSEGQPCKLQRLREQPKQ